MLAAIWQLFRNPGLVEAGISQLVILLLVLESSQFQSGLCTEEVVLLVSLDGGHPSSSHIVRRFDLPLVNEIKNLNVNPGCVLKMFRISKLFVVSSYFRFLSCTGSPLGPCSCGFSTGCHATFQHVSGFIVNSVWEFNSCAAESSVTSLRHSDRCTLGTVVKLQKSCCSPFAAVTKHNDSGAAAYLCVSGVTLQCSSLVRI